MKCIRVADDANKEYIAICVFISMLSQRIRHINKIYHDCELQIYFVLRQVIAKFY